MLDNMDPGAVAEASAMIKEAGFRDKVCIEVSGGLDKEKVLSYAVLDIDLISMGALTHSVVNFNVSLDMDAKVMPSSPAEYQKKYSQKPDF